MATAKTEIFKNQIVDIQTGEINEIILSAEELNEREISTNVFIAEREAKVAARQRALAKLAELGLTEEEIAAL